jgi:hypothetical protein
MDVSTFDTTLWQNILRVDLSNVQKRLSNEGWYDEEINTAILQYRRYWYLLHVYGMNSQLIPSQDIDEVWHAHILHTKQYAADCQDIFGDMLNHTPEYLEHTAQIKQHQRNFQKTRQLYQQHFYEPLTAAMVRNVFLRRVLDAVNVLERFIKWPLLRWRGIA